MVCSILYWVLVASLFLAVRAGSKTSDDTAPCSSFKINGSWDATFSFHRSWDFRNVKRGTKEDLDGGSWPPSEAEAATADPFPLSRAVSDQSWTDDWTVREWYREAAQPGLAALHYVPKMVSIGGDGDDGSGFLTLNTTRLVNDTQQGGEIFYTHTKVDAISLRVFARVSGASGAVAGFFTYQNDTQESDIEVLTKDTLGDTVHFSNQPTTFDDGSINNDATFNDTLPKDRSYHDWNAYRLDWLADQDQSVWYVNGKQLAKTTTHVPQTPGTVFLNMWSNGGWWSGAMKNGEHALLDIQWIEMVFNASVTPADPADGAVACTVEGRLVGTPVPAAASRLVRFSVGVWVSLAVIAWVAM